MSHRGHTPPRAFRGAEHPSNPGNFALSQRGQFYPPATSQTHQNNGVLATLEQILSMVVAFVRGFADSLRGAIDIFFIDSRRRHLQERQTIERDVKQVREKSSLYFKPCLNYVLPLGITLEP